MHSWHCKQQSLHERTKDIRTILLPQTLSASPTSTSNGYVRIVELTQKLYRKTLVAKEFEDFLSSLGRGVDNAFGAEKKKENKPIPPIRGKVIDNVFYVRADDVADALESQAPVINRRLIDKLRRKRSP